MAEITKEQFKVVGKNTKTMESISRPNIGYWQDAWRRIRKNKIAFFSLCLIGLYVLMAIFVPMFSKYDIATQSVAEMNQSFSKAHWFGTDSLGRDLWVRAWSGARVSLTIGFAASIINAMDLSWVVSQDSTVARSIWLSSVSLTYYTESQV